MLHFKNRSRIIYGFYFSITHEDDEMRGLISKTDHKTLALWSIDCAERVMHYFETEYTDDPRPREAINTLQEWIKTSKFSMRIIRQASLASHAAAKEIGNDSPAASAAHAAGQATAHVSTHSYGPAVYAQQAVFKATNSLDAVQKERDWQFQHLLDLGAKKY